jgi:hypothetical protein
MHNIQSKVPALRVQLLIQQQQQQKRFLRYVLNQAYK